jgi:uncharacterized surface protein with fasciclin (FAS1) repeats
MKDSDYVSIKKSEGINLILKHMHPVIAASFRSSGHNLFHFDRMTELLPGQGFVSRSFSSQPLFFDPSYFKFDRNSGPVNRLTDVAMVDISNFSIGSFLHVAEFYHGRAPFKDDRITSLVNWSIENVGLSHACESLFNYSYLNEDETLNEESWNSANKSLYETRRAVLNIHTASMIWRHAQAFGHKHVSDILLVAIWQYKLQDALSLSGAFTIFLPTDGAFPAEDSRFYEAALIGPNPETIISMILCYVVPNRLYLRPGDYLKFDRDSNTDLIVDSLVEEVISLSGKSIFVYRPRIKSSSLAPTIVKPQVRIGFGAVYSINGLLHHK